MNIWAVIPVKPLLEGKSRLSHLLTAEERADLTRRFLTNLLQELEQVRGIQRRLVISRDPAVLKIARRYGVSTYEETDGHELNSSLTRASHLAAAQRADCLLVLPADLPLATAEDVRMMIRGALPAAGNGNGAGYYYQKRALTICPDHLEDGTNALLICPPSGFPFRYGPDSFRLHLEEAERLGMDRRIIHAPGLKFDLDTEADLEIYRTLRQERSSASVGDR